MSRPRFSSQRLLATVLFSSLLSSAVALVSAPAVNAAEPEQICQRARHFAKGKYVACVYKALALFAGGVSEFGTDYEDAVAKCRIKYVQTWPKLQKSAAGSTCGEPRFSFSPAGTAVDGLSGLEWEQKTDDGSIHDKDNTYTWSTNAAGGGDGTSYTTFLETLNSAPCFAGHCDWRLPTLSELLSILLPEPYACTTNPCIDESSFGPTNVASAYWSASTDATDVSDPGSLAYSWSVFFDIGHVFVQFKGGNGVVRAVRGGL